MARGTPRIPWRRFLHDSLISDGSEALRLPSAGRIEVDCSHGCEFCDVEVKKPEENFGRNIYATPRDLAPDWRTSSPTRSPSSGNPNPPPLIPSPSTLTEANATSHPSSRLDTAYPGRQHCRQATQNGTFSSTPPSSHIPSQIANSLSPHQPPKRRPAAATTDAGPSRTARPSKLAKEHGITAQEETDIREAFSLFSEPMAGEKEGVIPIPDVRRALMYIPPPPPIPFPPLTTPPPLQRPRHPPLLQIRTRRLHLDPRPRRRRLRDVPVLRRHLRAQAAGARAAVGRGARGRGGRGVCAVCGGQADHAGAPEACGGAAAGGRRERGGAQGYDSRGERGGRGGEGGGEGRV